MLCDLGSTRGLIALNPSRESCFGEREISLVLSQNPGNRGKTEEGKKKQRERERERERGRETRDFLSLFEREKNAN